MQAEVSTVPVSAQAASALALHLRRHPDDALREPSDLAAQFGLSADFVHSVLLGIRETTPSPTAEKIHVNLSFVGRAWQGLVAFFDGVTSRPMAFIVITLGIAVGAGYALAFLTPKPAVNAARSGLHIQDTATLLIALATLALHLACYFKHRRGRYALYGGVVLWGTLIALTTMSATWRTGFGPEISPMSGLVLILFAMLMLSLMYAGLGALSAVMGGWIHVRRQRRRDEQMSRQEMLERYFELQGRLQAGPTHEGAADSVFDSKPVRLYQRYSLVWIASISFILHALMVGPLAAMPTDEAFRVNAWMFVVGLLQIVAILCHVAVGFFSRSLPWAIVNSLLFSLVGAIPEWFIEQVLNRPIGGSNVQLWALAANGAFYVGIAVAGGLGATVQRRADRDWSLQQNDPATILAEMVRLQWRLGDRATEVCVMVVDAAKSAEMKSAADPLAVEYSFREYQEWIQSISEALNGKIHATAGDGAIVAFTSCSDAFLAARRIQTDIHRFNREDNRLPAPFRLRVGIHVGSVAGELDKVQFAEVIDIAAHVQGVAPIAGIVVTSEVAAQLPEETFVPLANPVDGHPVLLALNPTTDE
jgi:class 3 adenylate cyclase